MNSLKRLGLAALFALSGCTSAIKPSTNPHSNELTDFVDTKKPNAVVVFPAGDYDSAFYNGDEEEFVGNIADNYDVYVIVADNENEVYDALDKMKAPGIDLLILNGHGAPEHLCLSYSAGENHRIDTSDVELKEHLGCLNKDARIILSSCYTGNGKDKEKNLANFLANISDRQVIAPDGIPKLRITRFEVPFDIDFYGNKKFLGFIPWRTNITYKTRN